MTPWDWLQLANYKYNYAGENLAISFQTLIGVHSALMQSPSHRSNVLNKNYTEIGVAIVDGLYNGRQTTIIVEFFGTQQH